MQQYSYLLHDSRLTKLRWVTVKMTHIGARVLSSLSHQDVKEFPLLQQEVSGDVDTVRPAHGQDASPARRAVGGDPEV